MESKVSITQVKVNPKFKEYGNHNTLTTNQINVAYYRVSTKMQGISGLGLEAQQRMVFGLLRKEPDFEFTEIESASKLQERPILKQAIEKCKQLNGRLVIACLDRLSRNLHFITGLQRERVDFVCADNPSATPFVLQILGSVAEQESASNSRRTKSSIESKIRREHEKGNINYKWGWKEGKKCSFSKGFVSKDGVTREDIANKLREAKRKQRESNPNNELASKFIKKLLIEGRSVSYITKWLNEMELKTPNNGNIWYQQQVYRIINNFEVASENISENKELEKIE